MLTDYTFLTDHSYSLRPITDDQDEIPLNQREVKSKKRRQSSSRTNKTTSAKKQKTSSLHRSSSDKENNSLIVATSNESPTSEASTSINTSKRSNKKKPMKSRASRLSTRTSINNSRSQIGNKQDNKTPSKADSKSTNKKKTNNKGTTNSLNKPQMDLNYVTPSLSIEERVKLRRTKPPQPSTPKVDVKPTKKNKSQTRQIQQHKKEIHPRIIKNSSKKPKTTPSLASKVQNKKFFLGSGLDLDNIVLGSRQRRCVQT